MVANILAFYLQCPLDWVLMTAQATLPRERAAFGHALRAESVGECVGALHDVLPRWAGFWTEGGPWQRGEWQGVSSLVHRWFALLDEVLEAASVGFPELVQRQDGDFHIRTATGAFSQEPVRYLQHLIAEVPFSPLVARFQNGGGAVLAAIDVVRHVLPGFPPLRDDDPAVGWVDVPDADPDRYRWSVDLVLRAMRPPLVRTKELFGLTAVDLAGLFGVSRQAVEQWERNGDVPDSRRAKLANLLSVGELLERKLSPGRLPLVARRPAAAYGGKTMLEMIAADRDGELLVLTNQTFDWSATA
jgi:transcriptional regulator with XRE-family HTH domain